MIRPLLLLVLLCACSDDPAAPDTVAWSRDELIGSWTGSLAAITVVPDTTIPQWDSYRGNQLYNQRYYFTDLNVIVNVVETSFLILLSYHSDSLVFMYSERGRWQLSGENPKQLIMDSTSVAGRLETWNSGINWQTSECCWQAELSVENGDFSSLGFAGGVLRISNINSRIDISDLVLEKQISILPGV